MSVSLTEALRWASVYLQEAGIAQHRLEAELLLAHLLQVERLFFYTHRDSLLKKKEWARYRSWIYRRAAQEPFAYIVGEKEFYGYRFCVNKAVLIPRPETEHLVEVVINWVEENCGKEEELHLLEHGTGSGALAITLALLLPRSQVWATELSPKALRVARSNAAIHKVQQRIKFIKSNFWENLPSGQLFQVIVSNPPYIPSAEIKNLPPDVRQEPLLALDGGQDGLDAYRTLLEGLPRYLAPGGLFAVECGYQQRPRLEKLFRRTGIFCHLEVHKDYAGHERILCGRRSV
jgi:release factor glutamine methyltransferase